MHRICNLHEDSLRLEWNLIQRLSVFLWDKVRRLRLAIIICSIDFCATFFFYSSYQIGRWQVGVLFVIKKSILDDTDLISISKDEKVARKWRGFCHLRSSRKIPIYIIVTLKQGLHDRISSHYLISSWLTDCRMLSLYFGSEFWLI